MAFNPFDLTGPQFLVFYSLVGVMLVGGLALYRYMTGSAGAGEVALSDPYAIACLRGGKQEMLQLATLVLIEKGLLSVNGERIVREKDWPGEKTTNPLEATLLREFGRSSLPKNVYTSQPVEAQCRQVSQSLAAQGAWISDEDEHRIFVYRWLVIAALLAVAGAKLGLAIARGRSNVWFLILEAAVFAAGAYFVYRHRRTSRGSRYLRDLRTLVERSRASGEDPGKNELLMLGAVLGVSALPAVLQSYSVSLFRPNADAGGGGLYVGGDSSDGGGSGCGGGGGCGGCGS